MLPLHDLRELAAPARETEAERLTRSEVTTPFDLTTGPMLRSLLLRLADEEHILVLTIHHIVSDGWSLNLLFRELAAFYAAFVAGTPPALPALPVQYADFAHWQRRWLTGDVLEAQRAYWMEQLAGELPVLNLPTDRARPSTPTLQGATRSAVIDAAILAGLRDLSRREGVTLFTTMLAAFKTLLLRYTGQEDLVVGALVAGRVRPEVEHLMGFFVNTLALRSDFSGDPTFREALRRTRDVVVGAHAHADFPFERLVEELQPERDLSRGPLFQVALNMLSFGFGADIALPGVRARPLPSLELHAVTDLLTLYVFEGHDTLELSFVYNTALFDVETIARLLSHVHTLLGGIVADPDRALSALPLLPPDESHRLLVEWNATETAFPLDETYARQFEAQATRTPDAVAAVADEGTLTYRELDARANRLARRLVAAGIGRDQRGGAARRAVARFPDLDRRRVQGGRRLPAARSPPPCRPPRRHPVGQRRRGRPRGRRLRGRAGRGPGGDGRRRPADVAPRGGPASAPRRCGRRCIRAERPRTWPTSSTPRARPGCRRAPWSSSAAMLNHLHAKIQDLGLTSAGRRGPDGVAVLRHLGLAVPGAAARGRPGADRVRRGRARPRAPARPASSAEAVTVLEIVPSVLASAFPDDGDARVSRAGADRVCAG